MHEKRKEKWSESEGGEKQGRQRAAGEVGSERTK